MKFIVRAILCWAMIIFEPTDQQNSFVTSGTVRSFIFFLMDEHRNSFDTILTDATTARTPYILLFIV
jgi:hypothetical protein